MSKNNKLVNRKFILLGVFSIAIGIALFVAGAVTGLDGQWYLMLVSIPFYVLGIIVIAVQLSKKFIEKQKLRSIELLKEIKNELSTDELSQEKLKCQICGATNNINAKFCQECGKPLN